MCRFAEQQIVPKRAHDRLMHTEQCEQCDGSGHQSDERVTHSCLLDARPPGSLLYRRRRSVATGFDSPKQKARERR